MCKCVLGPQNIIGQARIRVVRYIFQDFGVGKLKLISFLFPHKALEAVLVAPIRCNGEENK